MITNNKVKFTRSIAHIEVELGGKCGLFQTVEETIPSNVLKKRKDEIITGGTQEGPQKSAIEQAKATVKAAATQFEAQREVGLTQAQVAREQAFAAAKQADAQVMTAELQVDATKYAADAQVKAAKATNDPVQLDANEIAALELINKTGVLKDLPAFEAKLASGDKEATRDALTLEQALKKDGQVLTADGKITEKTILAAKALIGENLPAIEKYQELTGETLVPKASPIVQAITEGKTESISK